MHVPSAAIATTELALPQVRRDRLIRDRSILERFGLKAGEMYGVAHVAGGVQSRRVTRSLVRFEGATERRRWGGEKASCLDFVLPHGRPLCLLASQVVDVRPAGLNERGQWVMLAEDRTRRRPRSARRPRPG